MYPNYLDELLNNSYISNLGLSPGSFAGQEAFQLPGSSGSMYSPDYLNALAQSQGVDAGDPSLFSRLIGNTEQGLYKQEGALTQPAMSVQNMLQKQAQQKALGSLMQTGSNMQQQGQQSPQIQAPQAMMSKGKPVDLTTALLSLLQEKQQPMQPRISLI